jgi:zinc carboxypeptidase
MNNRMVTILAFIISVSMVLFGVSHVFAKNDIVPGGPFITDNQNVSLSRLSSYDELVKSLHQIEKSSKGLIELEVIGQTINGKDLYMAKVGDPDNDAVMIMTQQHGNEPMTTEAALSLLKKLGAGGKNVQGILDELYVLIVVRVNPEGAELFTRGNADFDAPPRISSGCFDDDGNVDPALINLGRGVYSTTYVDPDGNFLSNYDINRYHWPDWSQSWQILCNPNLYDWYGNENFNPDQNPVPEAEAVVNAFQAYQPLWMADFHHQGTYVTDDGESITSSILWPRNEDVVEEYVDLSKQLCVQIYDHMQQFGYATITLYPGGTFAGIARNAYGLMEAGSILVELKGGIGQKQSGMIIKHAYEQMMTILEATADGSLYDIPPERSDEIPPRGSYYYKEDADDGE